MNSGELYGAGAFAGPQPWLRRQAGRGDLPPNVAVRRRLEANGRFLLGFSLLGSFTRCIDQPGI